MLETEGLDRLCAALVSSCYVEQGCQELRAGAQARRPAPLLDDDARRPRPFFAHRPALPRAPEATFAPLAAYDAAVKEVVRRRGSRTLSCADCGLHVRVPVHSEASVRRAAGREGLAVSPRTP